MYRSENGSWKFRRVHFGGGQFLLGTTSILNAEDNNN